MKTVRFTYVIDGERTGYRCNQPGDQDGEYVPVSAANTLKKRLIDTQDVLQRLMPRLTGDALALAQTCYAANQDQCSRL